MLEAFSTRPNRILAFVFLALCGLCGIAAATIGTTDNPTGTALAYISVTAFILAFAHPWKTSQSFLRLLYGSILILIGGILCHIVFDILVSKRVTGWVLDLCQVLQIGGVMLAFRLGPPAFLIGFVGAILVSVLGKRNGAIRSTAIFMATAITIAGVGVCMDNCSSRSGRIIAMRDRQAGFNGGFESAMSGLPANWYFYNIVIQAGQAAVSIDTTEAMEGRQSLRFDLNRFYRYETWRPAGLFQTIPAVSGKPYQITGWVKSQGCELLIMINSNEEDPPANAIAQTMRPTPTWQQFEYLYTVPRERKSVRLDLRILNPGTLWIDNLKMQEAQGVAGE